MATRNVKVENRAGVHMRPSTLITKTSHEFKSDIFIIYNNARLTIEAIGEDEIEALNAIETLFTTKFAED